jgi:hypothetical protein
MTLVDVPRSQPKVVESQLLFQEAKQRRRRRWLASGIVALVFLVLAGVTIGLTAGRGGGSSRPLGVPAPIPGAARAAAELSFRPVLCYAPPLTIGAGQDPSSGPLPACSASTQLNAPNLQVTPYPSNVIGYTSNATIPSDPQFATYPSTTPSNDNRNDRVLLPGVPAGGDGRYVLGPAGVTGAAVRSASAMLDNGHWTVNLVLTRQGSLQWDALSKDQFHQIIGVDFNGRVISAPITQPTQSAWSSFNGRVQISGAFTERQAREIAAEL